MVYGLVNVNLTLILEALIAIIGEVVKMPIYEYTCEFCGHHHEVMQKISEAPLVKCPACGQLALKKLISPAGFRLSGSGWYETDFKKSGQRNLAKGDSPKTDAKDSKKSKSSDKQKSPTKTKSAS